MKNIYEIRAQGRDFCQTEGSDHYKEGGLEPLDLMMAKGVIEDFCIGNMIKYATRFKITRKLDDLKKVSDYAQILCGVELEKKTQEEISQIKQSSWVYADQKAKAFDDFLGDEPETQVKYKIGGTYDD